MTRSAGEIAGGLGDRPTHRACVTLIAAGDGRAIRHFGKRGREALADLRNEGIVSPSYLALTDLGRAVADVLAKRGAR